MQKRDTKIENYMFIMTLSIIEYKKKKLRRHKANRKIFENVCVCVVLLPFHSYSNNQRKKQTM